MPSRLTANNVAKALLSGVTPARQDQLARAMGLTGPAHKYHAQLAESLAFVLQPTIDFLYKRELRSACEFLGISPGASDRRGLQSKLTKSLRKFGSNLRNNDPKFQNATAKVKAQMNKQREEDFASAKKILERTNQPLACPDLDSQQASSMLRALSERSEKCDPEIRGIVEKSKALTPDESAIGPHGKPMDPKYRGRNPRNTRLHSGKRNPK